MRPILILAACLVAAGCESPSSSAPYDAGVNVGPGPGACPAECADTLCTSKSTPPSATCKACLARAVDTGGPCENRVVTACQAVADCTLEQTCVAFCQGNADAGSDAVCGPAGDLQACTNCCATRHKDGYDTFFSALVACGCGR